MTMIAKSDTSLPALPMYIDVTTEGQTERAQLFVVSQAYYARVTYETTRGEVFVSHVAKSLEEATRVVIQKLKRIQTIPLHELLTRTPAVYRGALRTIQSTEDGAFVVYYDNGGYYLTSGLGTPYEGEGTTIEEALHEFAELCENLFEEDNKCFNH
jgi:hypothetical protein